VKLVAGDLAAALDTIAKVIERRNTIPILANALIEPAGNGDMQLLASDLDICITATCPATDALAPFTVPALPFRKLLEHIAGNAELVLEHDDKTLTIAHGRSRWRLPTLPVEDFPARLVPSDTASALTFSAADFRRHFGTLSFAISTEETRYYLNGVYLHNSNSQLTTIATDGHRLARVTAPHEHKFPGIILPRKAVELAVDALGKNEAVELRFDDRIVEATIGTTVVASKVVDADYPEYTRVLPQQSENFCEVEREDLLEAIERLTAIMTREDYSAAGLTWAPGDDALTLVLTRSEAVNDKVAAAAVGGEARVGVSPRYLADMLKALLGETVRLEVTGPSMPIRVTVPGHEQILAVLMPLRW
jgi:DNA polymerase III subunit beta